MDFQTLNAWMVLCVTALVGLGWWLFRTLHAKVDQTDRNANLAVDMVKDQLSKHELYCAQNYVTNPALTASIETINRAVDAIFKKLERIDEKLDRKADKP